MLAQHVEALIFCALKPISKEEIKTCLKELFDGKVGDHQVTNAIERLTAKYKSLDFSFQIVRIAGGYQFLTKPSHQAVIKILLKQQSKKKLSNSAMETLAIVAYKQPVTKSEIEQIRGVNCDYSIQKLLEKQLLEIKGKSDLIGRPILYGTGSRFMDYFGINELKELPTPKDFKTEENAIGLETE